MIELGTQAGHPGQRISDRGCQRAFVGYVLELGVQPNLQGIEGGFGLSLSDLDPFNRGQPSCGLLDGVKLSNPPDGLVCNGRALRLVDIDELSSDMGQASDLADIAGAIQVFKSGIAVGVHPAGIFGEVIFGMLAFAVARELIPTGGWDGAAPRPLVTAIDPKSAGLGLAGAWCQHRHGSVIGEDCLASQHMPSDGVSQWLQQSGRFADPICQR